MLNMAASVSLIIIINRSKDSGFFDIGAAKNSVDRIDTLIIIIIYKCESWTHSNGFKGHCAPYTNIILRASSIHT